jgi:hypothetical protein
MLLTLREVHERFLGCFLSSLGLDATSPWAISVLLLGPPCSLLLVIPCKLTFGRYPLLYGLDLYLIASTTLFWCYRSCSSRRSSAPSPAAMPFASQPLHAFLCGL